MSDEEADRVRTGRRHGEARSSGEGQRVRLVGPLGDRAARTETAVGNDVVDLGDPAIARHHEDQRFVARVCSEDERARVSTAFDLWRFFAAKEAAYKALVQLGDSPGFGHRSIRVATDFASVSWGGRRLALTVTSDPDHVHAVAWSKGPEPTARVVRSEGVVRAGEEVGEGSEEGARARAALRDLVAKTLGCEPGELEIVRDPIPGAWDGFGPPRVERSGERVDADVSLSHDGRFVAAAALVRTAI